MNSVQPVTERLQHFIFDGFRNAACSPSDWFSFMDLQIRTNRLASRLPKKSVATFL